MIFCREVSVEQGASQRLAYSLYLDMIGSDKEKVLQEKMERLGIKESDIIERFVRSSGKGGQNVNKVSTCVYLKHLPTGIEVKCQRERYQAMNRFLARRLLAEKIENLLLGKESEEQHRIEKVRRQKRRRSRRAKEKVLEMKHLQAGKKKERAVKPDASEY
jgi:peptide chain release factor